MKLSEAISLASVLSPQAIGRFEDDGGGRCALASAFEAIGQSPVEYAEWNWAKRVSTCPVCGRKTRIAYLIMHLNDRHRWNRERIAQWVAAVEPTEQTPPDGEEYESVASF